MLLRNLEDRPHLHRQTVNMHHHDGLGMRCDLRLDLPNIHVPSHGIGIDHHRRRTGPHNRRPAGYDGESRHDDFVAWPDPQRRQSHIQRDAAIADRDPVFAAGQCSHASLKALHKRPLGRDPPRLDALAEILLLVPGKNRRVDENHKDGESETSGQMSDIKRQMTEIRGGKPEVSFSGKRIPVLRAYRRASVRPLRWIQ